MNQPLISVIVPVYNVEKYLDRCVESIVDQTYRNLEIILVDDGSPDNCPQMCDEWAKKDKRITVIHKKNEGAGRARNIGLDKCEGEFVSFIDSDDYLAKDFINKLYLCFDKKVGITECEYSIVLDDNFLFSKNRDKTAVYDVESALRHNIYDDVFKQVIWNKLYRKSIISDIRFPEHSKIDDEFWTYKVIANCENLIHLKSVLYAYRQQQNSVMHNLTIEQRRPSIIAKEERALFIRDRYPQIYSDSVFSLLCTCIYQTQMVYKYDMKKDRKEFLEFSSEYFKKYRLDNSFLKNIEFKQRIWMKMSCVSLSMTCRIRNIFGVGF